MTDPIEGPFGGLSRAERAVLAREWLLAGHLIDRAGMPHLIGDYGLEVMRDIAIEEWMGASPVYTRRMQRALGFVGGTDVATIFKGMQLDIGAPPEFMDFRYEVHDADHGEFRLASCGALMDVEPMGDDFVVAMCHHIEDPTFDATACATNPRAQVRPIHRPPRQPADRHPHCHWTVTVVADASPVAEPAAAVALTSSRAATVACAKPGDDGEGLADYAGPFNPDLRLESFSTPTLATLLQEVALQGHLLTRSFMLAVARRFGTDDAVRIGGRQLTGVAGLVARRLVRLLDPSPDVAGIARVFALHPAFHPSAYVALRVDAAGDELTIALDDCAALQEGDLFTWPALLAAGRDDAVAAIAREVTPHAQVRRLPGGAAWSIRVDPAAAPAPELTEVVLTAFSTGADFRFRPRNLQS